MPVHAQTKASSASSRFLRSLRCPSCKILCADGIMRSTPSISCASARRSLLRLSQKRRPANGRFESGISSAIRFGKWPAMRSQARKSDSISGGVPYTRVRQAGLPSFSMLRNSSSERATASKLGFTRLLTRTKATPEGCCAVHAASIPKTKRAIFHPAHLYTLHLTRYTLHV